MRSAIGQGIVLEEKDVNNIPICMVPTTQRDTLPRSSRLDYSKLFTLKYDAKVRFVGEIRKDLHSQLLAGFNIMYPYIFKNDIEPQPLVTGARFSERRRGSI